MIPSRRLGDRAEVSSALIIFPYVRFQGRSLCLGRRFPLIRLFPVPDGDVALGLGPEPAHGDRGAAVVDAVRADAVDERRIPLGLHPKRTGAERVGGHRGEGNGGGGGGWARRGGGGVFWSQGPAAHVL